MDSKTDIGRDGKKTIELQSTGNIGEPTFPTSGMDAEHRSRKI